MIDSIQDDEIAVFLVNGFLDSGKTAFVRYTLEEEYFGIDGNTLLIVCEDGEERYDEKDLQARGVFMVQVEEQEMLTKAFLEDLNSRYTPERVVIEFNGMWDPTRLEFPEKWVLYQQITLMDGSTLDSYLLNMKSLFGPMLRNTELVIVNRCDGFDGEHLLDWKRKLRPMLSRDADIVMENGDGDIPLETLPEELPYDLEAPVIEILPEYFGLWFFDAKDYPQRYDGKTVSFTACIMKNPRFRKDCFVPGRMAMTCCENDMTFIGFMAHYEGLRNFKNHCFVKLTADISIKDLPEYGGPGPFLEVREMILTAPIEEPVGF